MTTPETLYHEILRFCRSHADEALVKKYSRYFKEGGYDAYGVAYPLMQEKVKEILALPGIDLGFVMQVSQMLIPGTKYEEPSFALMMVKALKKQYTPETFTEIGRWFDLGIRNWAHTDALCSEILSVFLLKQLVDYKDLGNWKLGVNKFKRRAVPVSLIKLMKETRKVKEYVDFVESLMMDPAREVHQGVGWFLREAWKIEPAPVEEILLKYKETAARLIFQYATEKMSAEQKARFRRSKNS
ncbi:MAG: DNA alkylation repair protein [Bacteroidales bacterium]|jgi:3-methyladenine DNA glycosylase AlkD|nr:DNA alkylation repair protein [Bacteroidales bacterium]